MTTTSVESTDKSEQDKNLLKQIEFYFGDANLPFDKFIKLQCSQNEGWFPINLLLRFNRLRALIDGLSLSSDEDRLQKILEILRESVLVEIHESGSKIRRNPEMPLPVGNSEHRTVYIKGFHRTETKLQALIDHFSKYEGFEAVVMRWYKEKVLISTPLETPDAVKTETDVNVKKSEPDDAVKTESDSVKAEPEAVKTEADAVKVEPTVVKTETNGTSTSEKDASNSTDTKPVVDEKNIKESSIKVIPTKDTIAWHKKFKGSIFVVFKTVENAKVLLEEKNFSFPGNQAPYIKMLQKEYKQKKKEEFEERSELRRKVLSGEEPKKEVGEEENNAKIEEDVDAAHLNDVLIKINTIPEGFSRESLKGKWYAVAPEEKFSIAFVDFQRGDTTAVLRLEREGAAKEVLELLSGKLKLGDDVFSVIEGFEGEAEKAYNAKIDAERAKMKRKNPGFGRRGGRGGRGGGKRRRY